MLGREQLHGYQRYAAGFIVEHPASAILLDCGCGKTIITLTAIEELLRDRFEIQRVLVICPSGARLGGGNRKVGTPEGTAI